MLLPSALLAAVAAGCNAAASAFQRKANRRMRRRRFNARLVSRLVREPVWLLGFGAMLVSFLLQALALRLGPLALVEPVLAVELPLTLLFASWLLKHPLHHRDLIAAAVMAGGLAMFIAALAPGGGDTLGAATSTLLLAALATTAGIGALVLAAVLGPRRGRAALFGAAAGAGFGLTAALLKIVVSQPDALFVSWETYAMAASGAGSVLLVQAALHAGTLVAAQPGFTLVDPLVSVLWGVLVFGETPRQGPVLVLAGIGGLAIIAAVLALAEASARAVPSGATRRRATKPAPSATRGGAIRC